MSRESDKEMLPAAVMSVRLALLSFCLLGLFTAVPAVVLGHLALAAIHNDPHRYTGHNQAVLGTVLGYIGIAASIVAMYLFYYFFLRIE